MCTVKKANIVVTSLALFGFVAYNFGIWTSESGHIRRPNGTEIFTICTTKAPFRPLVNIMNNMDTVVTLILPLCVITVLNLQIIRTVTRLNRDHHHVLYSHPGPSKHNQNTDDSCILMSAKGPEHKTANLESRSVSQGQSRKNPPKSLSREQSNLSKSESCSLKGSLSSSGKRRHPLSQNITGQNRITKMLLVVSTMFLLLNLPAHSIRIYFFVMAFVNPYYQPPRFLISLQKLFTYLYYVNFSINFFLYSLCGHNFRTYLWQMMSRPFVEFRTKFWSMPRRQSRRGDGESQRATEEVYLSPKSLSPKKSANSLSAVWKKNSTGVFCRQPYRAAQKETSKDSTLHQLTCLRFRTKSSLHRTLTNTEVH